MIASAFASKYPKKSYVYKQINLFTKKIRSAYLVAWVNTSHRLTQAHRTAIAQHLAKTNPDRKSPRKYTLVQSS